jgi:hypothetical protein
MPAVFDHILAPMSIQRGQLSPGLARFWRSSLRVVLICAVVIQSLFLGFAGVAASVSADDGLPTFELCLNGHQDGPLSPADLPGSTHCIFCFAGTHFASGPPPLASFQRINLEVGDAWWPLENWRLPDFYEYSSAQPRGPPLDA